MIWVQSISTYLSVKEGSEAEATCLLFLLASLDVDVARFLRKSYYGASVHH